MHVRTHIAKNNTGQIHTFGGGLNSTVDHWENLGFEQITGFSHGHHARAGGGYDVFNFQDLDNVRATIVGRIEDFDPTHDEIRIEGEVIDLAAPPENIRIVEYNGAHNDAGADPQLWLLITTGSGGQVFYTLEGARVDMNGDGTANSGTQEGHFLLKDQLPDFATLRDVPFVDPQNYVPAGVSGQGGVVINDTDADAADVQALIVGSSDGDLIAAGLNDDMVRSGAGNDRIWGGSGHDSLFGNTGNDSLYGGFGDDRLDGGYGNDRIDGGRGDDLLKGGAGADRFVFADGHGRDRITDFDTGDAADVLDFSALGTMNSVRDVLGRCGVTSQIGDDLVIRTGHDSSVTLEGISRYDLAVDDFIF